MSGAVGSVQLTKWNNIMETRLANKEYFFSLFANKSWCRIQKEIGESSWFTFGMVLDGELKGRRAEVINALSKAGIQNRPLASRNFLKQPVMRDLNCTSYIRPMTAADDIHDNGFFVGNGSKDIKEGINKMYEVISSFVE
jgi:CDP-6-deoxy-D-xylo-4-hexulose-3-dehydrase